MIIVDGHMNRRPLLSALASDTMYNEMRLF